MDLDQKNAWENFYSKGLEWRKESSSLSPILKNKKVLELGVGNGKTLVSILRQKPLSVHAIDFSAKSIEICKKKFNENHVFFHVGDMLSIPIEDNSFDIVVCYYILNSLSGKDRKQAVKEIKRVLKPNGTILFEDFLEGDFRQESMKKTKEKLTFINKSGIKTHFFSIKEIKSLFASFKTIKLKKSSFKAVKSLKSKRVLVEGVFTNANV